MTFLPKKVLLFLFLTLNIIIALLALLVAFGSYADFPILSFLGLIFPYTILVLLLFVFFWSVFKPLYILISVASLLLCYKEIKVFFGSNKEATFIVEKSPKTIRMLDWNIQGFNGLSSKRLNYHQSKTEIIHSILKFDPAILCLQEFNTSIKEEDNIQALQTYFPYYYFSPDYISTNKTYQSGNIIFSKYPILQTATIRFSNAESAIKIDLKINNDTISIFTTHLASYKFKKQDYELIEKISSGEEAAVSSSKSLIKKMINTFSMHNNQAAVIAEALAKNPYPTIVCGDFNEVPNSFVYKKIKGKKLDAFLEKGWGFGKTYMGISPLLRIDYIFYDSFFQLAQFDIIDEALSDHYLLLADIIIPQ